MVQCAEELADGQVAAAAAHVAALGGSAPAVLELRLEDTPVQPLGAALAEAVPRIQAARAAGGTVLVSCAAGRSRSAAVVMALLVADGAALADAWARVRSDRPWAYPNVGFLAQLRAFEQRARGSEPSITEDDAVHHGCWRLQFSSESDGRAFLRRKLAAK